MRGSDSLSIPARIHAIVGLLAVVEAMASPPDASDVTWAHAVNSRDALERALASPVHFLEADISLGHLLGSQEAVPVPVMAHPPSSLSDISLDQWLESVAASSSRKGIKLDLKSTEALEPSLICLKRYALKLHSSVWLNADILPGPVNAATVPVDAESFLAHCHQYFPEATLSIGWTTYWDPTATPSPHTWHYEWLQVRTMVDVVRGSESPFTFPVRGIFAARSIRVLRWLLATVPDSSLTVWTGHSDPLTIQDLLRIRSSFPRDKVYYDLPDDLHREFAEAKNSVDARSLDLQKEDDGQWRILTRGHEDSSSSSTYVSNDTVVFGRSLTTAVLRKGPFVFGKESDVRIRGLVEFSNEDVSRKTSPPEAQELTLVLSDVSHFSKNASDASTTRDTDAVWSAIEASAVFTFRHTQEESACRAFQLKADETFEAWTVPCSGTRGFDEIVKAGVPTRKRLLLPRGPLVFGLLARGDGHVVVHDLAIDAPTSGSRVAGAFLSLFTLGACFVMLIGSSNAWI